MRIIFVCKIKRKTLLRINKAMREIVEYNGWQPKERKSN